MALSVPSKYVAGLGAIIALPDESVEELVAALSKIPTSINLRAVAANTATNVKSISKQNAGKIVRAIVSLYAARFYSGNPPIPVGEFVDDLLQAFSESGRKELQFPAQEKERIKTCFERLLSFEAFTIGSKALNLQYEHESTFCAVRVLTDARPVYGQDPKIPPSAVVIIHTLKVSYHRESNEAVRDFYVAMDAEDIRKLREALDRAELKAVGLKSLLDSTGVLVLE